MQSPKAPDSKYVRENANRLTNPEMLAAISNNEGLVKKLAAARGRFARQQHKLELLRMVVTEGLAGGETGLDELELKIAVYPFHYLLDTRDLIPDSVPVAGFSDDLAVIIIAWKLIEDKLKTFAAARGLLASKYFDINESD
jgi:uncharacterized membrane protein YkvA (DUF1232 family)